MSKKKREKSKRTSFFSDFKVYWRSVKITYKLDPPFFWMQIVNAVGYSLRSLINAFLAALVINGIYAGESKETLMLYAAIVVVSNFLINLAVLFTANRRYIRKSMWSKVLKLFFNSRAEEMDYAHFEDVKIKDIYRKIDRNINSGKGISNYWTWYNFITAFTGLAATVTILATMLFSVSTEHTEGILHFVNTPWAVLLFAALLATSFFYSNWYEKNLNDEWRRVNDKYAEISRVAGKVTEYPVNTKLAMDMHIYGLESVIDGHAEEFTKEDYLLYRKLYIKQNSKDNLKTAFDCFVKLIACLFIGLKALSGAFGVGSFVLYLTTVLQFTNAVSQFGWAVGDVRGNRKILDEEFSFVDIENKMKNGTRVPEAEGHQHTLEFRGVSFRYPGADDYTLKNVNLKFQFGERLAIVGMNGSGKTTFIKLLCRLYDPQEGEILLDGIDIREYDYKEYLKLFSVVFQDFKLFAFPLAENVAANRTYDAERVEKCLIQAGFGERLKTMPKGIETCLYKGFDPDGVEISGGEAQKIALARALYKDAPLVVLDEPTAALDPIAEADIYSRFNEMINGKTAIYISHRLSSCRFCDKIVVFDNGTIVQYGTHDTLVSDENGTYHKLWNAQAQYYKK